MMCVREVNRIIRIIYTYCVHKKESTQTHALKTHAHCTHVASGQSSGTFGVCASRVTHSQISNTSQLVSMHGRADDLKINCASIRLANALVFGPRAHRTNVFFSSECAGGGAFIQN